VVGVGRLWGCHQVTPPPVRAVPLPRFAGGGVALADNWSSARDLLMLHAFADAACADILDESKGGNFIMVCRDLLKKRRSLALFHSSRGVVLPKRHTAQVGMTLRSLSLHIAFSAAPVVVKWLTRQSRPSAKVFDILLFPWPFRVQSPEFTCLDGESELAKRNEQHRYFQYAPEAGADSRGVTELDDVLKNLKNELGDANVDLVVLPECAMQDPLIGTFKGVLQKHKVGGYVVGLWGRTGDHELSTNLLELGIQESRSGQESEPETSFLTTQQSKHHRWRLDRGQIAGYSLSRSLDPKYIWWEAIQLKPREITFVDLSSDVTVAPLICEDLARQDPAAQLIRAVGPSLVIALLMDGPQLRTRWSANYATVLADDPGSSVLTVTCRGMVDRWQSAHQARRGVVALWKDCKSGLAREIEITDSKAILLRLEVEESREYSADDRWRDRKHLVLREVLPVR
jgi:hypothetical protein